MRYPLLVVFLFSFSCVSSISAHSQDSFDLPIKVWCNDEWSISEGVFLCNQVTNKPLLLKIKIPPTKGSFRVVNCNRDLTVDGNPDDFDSQIWKSGWWIFSKVVRVFAETPQIIVPLEEMRKSDCPIVVSEYAEYAGGHNAVLLNVEDKRLADFLEYSCAGKPFISTGSTRGVSGLGLGVCRGLVGAEVLVRLKAKENTAVVISGSKCEIFEQYRLKVGESFSVRFDLSKGVCPVTVEAMALKKTVRSVFLFVGIPRENYMIDSPLLVKDGNMRRAILPISASMLSVEIYKGEKIVWRSGRKDASFSFNDNSNSGSGSSSSTEGGWSDRGEVESVSADFSGLVGCLTGYSRDSNSMSGACYDLSTMKELSYFFN